MTKCPFLNYPFKALKHIHTVYNSMTFCRAALKQAARWKAIYK